MAENMNDVTVIRKFILGQTKPFCTTDLYIRAAKKGITDRGLVLKVLNELFAEGIVLATNRAVRKNGVTEGYINVFYIDNT